MNSFIVSVNAVLPMFLMMATGFTLKTIGFLEKQTTEQMNKLVFRLLLPVMLFKSSWTADLTQAADGLYLMSNVVLTLISFLIIVLIAGRITPAAPKRASLQQGMFRGNMSLIGMSIAQSLYGPENTGIMAILVTAMVPVYNILGVFALAGCGEHPSVRDVLKKIVTNPLIIGCVAGLIMNISGLGLPKPIISVIDSFSNSATPVALIALGASFRIEKVGADKNYIFIGLLSKLVLLPLVMVTAGVALGFRGIALGSMMIVHAAPVSASSYTMAQQMGADGDLAASLVVFSGMLSCFTIFLWVFCLLQLGFI